MTDESWHILPNPWQDWLHARENWQRWQYMHQLYGRYEGEQACRGCAWVKRASYIREFVTYSRDDCTCFPEVASASGRFWDMNYPACGLFRKTDIKKG